MPNKFNLYVFIEDTTNTDDKIKKESITKIASFNSQEEAYEYIEEITESNSHVFDLD